MFRQKPSADDGGLLSPDTTPPTEQSAPKATSTRLTMIFLGCWIAGTLLVCLYSAVAYAQRRHLIMSTNVNERVKTARDVFLWPWSEYQHADSRFFTHRATWLIVLGYAVLSSVLLVAVVTARGPSRLVLVCLWLQMIYTFCYGISWLVSYERGHLDLASTTWQIGGLMWPCVVLGIVIPGILAHRLAAHM